MARRKIHWRDSDKEKTVFGSSSAGIRSAINVMSAAVMRRHRMSLIPTGEAMRMVIRQDDIEPLRRAARLTSLQNRDNHEYMLRLSREYGDWTGVSSIHLVAKANDLEAAMAPDYVSPTHWSMTRDICADKGTLMPDANPLYEKQLAAEAWDMIETAHNWALVQALFNYFDSKPGTYTKRNVRYMWSGIMTLLRSGGESCRATAMMLHDVRDTWWCETPKEIYPALRVANETIALGLLSGEGLTNGSDYEEGYVRPRLMCGAFTHPSWQLGVLQPKL